jgi:hypothetical protein
MPCRFEYSEDGGSKFFTNVGTCVAEEWNYYTRYISQGGKLLQVRYVSATPTVMHYGGQTRKF